jgi:hypothetical protein
VEDVEAPRTLPADLQLCCKVRTAITSNAVRSSLSGLLWKLTNDNNLLFDDLTIYDLFTMELIYDLGWRDALDF